MRHPHEVPLDASGYVLVCPSTDPGYTLAMARAVALVVATGGVLSHGAIVARELGLPAVSNIPVEAVTPGTWLHVDGQSGHVTREVTPGGEVEHRACAESHLGSGCAGAAAVGGGLAVPAADAD